MASHLKKRRRAFDDELAFIYPDELHPNEEARAILIGFSNRNRLVLLVFTERGETVRIVSARRAEPKERKLYEQTKRY